MKKLLLLAALVAAPAQADEVRFGELRELSMEYFRIANHRDSYFSYADQGDDLPREHWYYGTAVKFDLDLVRFRDVAVHWRNRVEGLSTNTQFRSVAWEFRWGVNLGDRVELFYDHLSQHCLECEPEDRSYGLKNFYGVEITFLKRSTK